MADKKISELVNITGSNIADTDEFVVVDSSASETKAITASELRTAIGNGDFTVTGDLTVQGTTITVDSATAQNIVLGDNDKMTFGAGSDLQIYHTGAESIILDNGTGNLDIRADSLSLLNAAGSEYYARFYTNGAANLYHNGSLKFNTTSTGIDVTGTVTADTSVVIAGSTGSTASLRLQAEELHADIVSVNEGVNYGGVKIQTNSNGTLKDRQKIESNGDISFYEDTGTTAKFFWDAAAESLGIGTSSPAYELDVVGASDTSIRVRATGAGSGDDALLRMSVANADASNFIQFGDNSDSDAGYIRYRHSDDSLQFGVNASERMRLTSSGSVGIGTTSPSAKLDVAGTVNAYGNGSVALQWGDTSALGSLSFDGSANPVIRSASSKPLVFQTNGANERMRIDSSGKVGIGTSTFDNAAQVVVAKGDASVSASDADNSGFNFTAVPDTTTGKVGIGFKTFNETASAVAALYATPINQYRNSLTARYNADGSGAGYFSVEQLIPASGTVSERMRIDSSGNVGIGTTSPAYKLDVNSGNINAVARFESTDAAAEIDIVDSLGYSRISNNSGNLYFEADRGNANASSIIRFDVDGAERMRIDSSGNVSIGTTVGSNKLVLGGETAVYPEAINVLETGHATSRRAGLKAGGWVFGQDSGGSGTKDFFIYDGNTGHSRFKIATNGELFSYTSDTTAPSTIFGASTGQMLRSENSEFAFGLSNASPYPLYIQGRNNINAARDIALQPSGGNLMVGRTSPQNLNTAVSFEVNDNTVNNVWAHQASTTTGAGTGIFVATTAINSSLDTSGFFYDAATNWSTSFVRKFAVRKDGVIFSTNTSISSLSDRRIKENIVDATDGTDGLDVINGLRVRRFDYKSGYGRDLTNQVGFIAQEVETVLPSIVDRMHDMEYNNDGESLRTLQEGKLVPILVKAIQEQQATITSLESRIAALETQVNS